MTQSLGFFGFIRRTTLHSLSYRTGLGFSRVRHITNKENCRIILIWIPTGSNCFCAILIMIWKKDMEGLFTWHTFCESNLRFFAVLSKDLPFTSYDGYQGRRGPIAKFWINCLGVNTKLTMWHYSILSSVPIQCRNIEYHTLFLITDLGLAPRGGIRPIP